MGGAPYRVSAGNVFDAVRLELASQRLNHEAYIMPSRLSASYALRFQQAGGQTMEQGVAYPVYSRALGDAIPPEKSRRGFFFACIRQATSAEPR
jgi:hypothetical protein